MSIMETVRPKSRTKPSSTLQELVNRPLPKEAEAALVKVVAAKEALERAESARYNALSDNPEMRLTALRPKLAKLLAQQDAAGPLGEDAPDSAEVQKMQQAVADAETAVANRAEQASAYREVIDDKRADLDAAHGELNAIVVKWKAPIIAAAEAQLGEAIAAANEALAIVLRLDTWRGYHPNLYARKFEGEGLHNEVPIINLPEPLTRLLDVFSRAHRRLLR